MSKRTQSHISTIISEILIKGTTKISLISIVKYKYTQNIVKILKINLQQIFSKYVIF